MNAAGWECRGQRVGLRTAEPADQAFFRDLYGSTREEELAIVPWSDEAKRAFLDQQFHAQSQHYAVHCPDAEFAVIVTGGVGIGRLYVHRRAGDIRIMEMALVPEWRRCGLGTAILRSLQEEAAASARKLSIHVEKFNPARRLYERLGFAVRADVGVHWLMEWEPPVS